MQWARKNLEYKCDEQQYKDKAQETAIIVPECKD